MHQGSGCVAAEEPHLSSCLWAPPMSRFCILLPVRFSLNMQVQVPPRWPRCPPQEATASVGHTELLRKHVSPVSQ